MHSPVEYEKNTTVQTIRDARNVLESIKGQLSCSENEKILDIGCGPGDLTTAILPLYFPTASTIIGCDISEAMVQYAQKKYGCERYQFYVLDIEKPSLWINSNKGKFDKMFSSFAFHWMKNLNQVTENMNILLKENGHVIFLSLLTHPLVELFGLIPTVTKWKKFVKPWHSCGEVQSTDNERKIDYINILEKNNFEVIKCDVEPVEYLLESLDKAIGIFDSVNPFKRDIPEDKYQSFLEDCKDYIQLCGLIKQNQLGKYVLKYTLLVVYAKKKANLCNK
ncbi:juvenile hormone acid O-methyltransferase-like [Rhodnius prolixus]|uniref:Methyltranfer_dom domain-containing protein n=1 Tax=Rhodnius prolixus TaxID=13249 RepID=T1IGC0_RHOPR